MRNRKKPFAFSSIKNKRSQFQKNKKVFGVYLFLYPTVMTKINDLFETQ